MKAADFLYERPSSLAAALALLGDATRDVAALAGGQSLMPMMNFRMTQPDLLVDLNGLPELQGIAEDGDRVVIGAMTRYAELARSELVARHIPLFAKALPHIAHPAIRNRGTIGGSVALADPAAEMPALLLALEAEIEIQGAGGTRRIAARDFFLGLYETARAPGELVVSVSVRKAAPSDRFGFYELARRHGDYAMVGVAIAASDLPLSNPRVAFFAVSDRALRATGTEAALDGWAPGDDLTRAVAALSEIDFAADLNATIATKRHLAGVILKRALAET